MSRFRRTSLNRLARPLTHRRRHSRPIESRAQHWFGAGHSQRAKSKPKSRDRIRATTANDTVAARSKCWCVRRYRAPKCRRAIPRSKSDGRAASRANPDPRKRSVANTARSPNPRAHLVCPSRIAGVHRAPRAFPADTGNLECGHVMSRAPNRTPKTYAATAGLRKCPPRGQVHVRPPCTACRAQAAECCSKASIFNVRAFAPAKSRPIRVVSAAKQRIVTSGAAHHLKRPI